MEAMSTRQLAGRLVRSSRRSLHGAPIARHGGIDISGRLHPLPPLHDPAWGARAA